MNAIKASWFGFLGVAFFIFSAILGGLQFSNYSHISQFISESYAIDTPYGIYLRYFGFFPSGIFFALFAFLAIKALPKSKSSHIGFLGIGVFYGIATILVSVFPCDKGCGNELVDPSFSQLIHNLTGLLTYLTVPICLLILGLAARKWEKANYVSYFGIFGGITAIVFFGILSEDLHSKFAGLYQRMIEGPVLAWIALCSFYLKNIRSTDYAIK